MKVAAIGLITILFSSHSFSQSAVERKAILVPINQIFKGMDVGDSAMVHGAFADMVTFVSVFTAKNGKPLLRPELLDEFLKAVGTPHPEAWNEKIWDVQIRVDGNFAQVWAKYAFYLDNKLSHCGVDAFHLFKGEDCHWEIFHLADTRQKEGCKVPKQISDQFK